MTEGMVRTALRVKFCLRHCLHLTQKLDQVIELKVLNITSALFKVIQCRPNTRKWECRSRKHYFSDTFRPPISTFALGLRACDYCRRH